MINKILGSSSSIFHKLKTTRFNIEKEKLNNIQILIH